MKVIFNLLPILRFGDAGKLLKLGARRFRGDLQTPFVGDAFEKPGWEGKHENFANWKNFDEAQRRAEDVRGEPRAWRNCRTSLSAARVARERGKRGSGGTAQQ